jgi:hypothetical protein
MRISAFRRLGGGAIVVGAAIAFAPSGITAAATPPGHDRHLAPTPRDYLAGWGTARNRTITFDLLAHEHWLADHGVELRQWGPDPATRKVEIFLAHYTADAARLLRARYGPAVEISKAAIGPGFLLNRRNDSPPFNGGDRLSNGCSSGPVVFGNHSSSTTYVLSAGHCSPLGATVSVGRKLMGKVVKRQFKNHGLDTELINDLGGGYNGEIWGGGANDANPPTFIEDGTLFAQHGALITNDSAKSGQINGIKVLRVDQMYKLKARGITIIDLTEVYKRGRAICRAGDSGGAWIKVEGGGLAKVVGTTSIGAGPVNGGFKFCYIEQIGSITRAFRVHVP